MTTPAATPNLDKLSPEIRSLVQEYAFKYGIPAEFLATVIIAESGGDPNSVNDTRGQTLPSGYSPEYSVGLIQLNLLGGQGGDYRGQPDWALKEAAKKLLDPRANLDIGVPPIADAYQKAQAKGETGQDLWDDVM